MKKEIFIQALVLFSTLALSGCMTFNEEMLRKVAITPPANPSTTIVEIKTGELVQKLNGEGTNRGVFSGTTVLNSLSKSIMSRWKNLSGNRDARNFAGSDYRDERFVFHHPHQVKSETQGRV